MTKRVIIQGRAAFLRVDKPERFQGTGDPRYSGNVIIERDSEAYKTVMAAMRAAAADQWGEAKADAAVNGLTKALKTALVDGDTKPDLDGYADHWVVQAHAKANQPPTLVMTQGGQNVRLDRETQTVIYGGCYVNAIIEFWAQDNKWGKRINAQLCGLQFVRDGDPFAGGKPADATDFDTVEEASPADFGGDDDVNF